MEGTYTSPYSLDLSMKEVKKTQQTGNIKATDSP